MARAPHEVEMYVQIEREDYPRYYNGKVRTAVARRITAKKPADPLPGAIVVKLTVRIPDEAFQPLTPAAIIDVPLELIQRAVEVQAGDADE